MENKAEQHVQEAINVLKLSQDNPLFANKKALLKFKNETLKAIVEAGYNLKV